VATRDWALVGVPNHLYLWALSRYGLTWWLCVTCRIVPRVIWWIVLRGWCDCVVVVGSWGIVFCGWRRNFRRGRGVGSRCSMCAIPCCGVLWWVS